MTAILASGGCQHSTARKQERLTRFFAEAAFDWDPEQGFAHDTLVRWEQPIRVDISGEKSGNYRDTVMAQLARAARLTGLDIAAAEGSEIANFGVLFVAKEDFLVNREYVPCYARIESADGRMRKVAIEISVEREDLIDNCIAHELFHGFGFRGHSALVRSVLSPLHGETDLTSWDELILRVLYDDRLVPGMPRDKAVPAASEIIKEPPPGEDDEGGMS